MALSIPGISDMVNLFKNVWNLLCSIPNIFISAISMIISMIFYGIQMGFFLLIDCVNALFRSIAGLDVYYVNGVETEGDIVYSLLQNPVVTSVLTSVLVASIFLLFVTTFIAIFKTEFDMSKSNAKGPIIGRAIKSILYFACVPIICILGVYISNVFLRTFDAATSQGAASMSGQVFAAAAYDANRARTDSSFANRVKNNNVIPGITASSTQAEVAQAIDDAFRSNSKAKGISSDDDTTKKYIEFDITWKGHMQGWAVMSSGVDVLVGGTVKIPVNNFSINNAIVVYYFYDLLPGLGYNYLIGILSSFMVAMLLLTLIIGVIQRIFELVILFVISPAFVATMPLDEGARFGKWKDAFVKRTMSAYGPVVGINLLFMVLTFLQDIDIFDPNMFMGGFFNALVQCLFMVVGLIAVKDFSGMISELVGSNDALTQAENKKGDVKNLGGKVATAGAIGVRAGAKTAAWAGRNAGRFGQNRLIGRENKAIDRENAKIDAAEQQAIEKIKNNWGLTDKEAKQRYDGWKNGTLTGATKSGMDFLVKNNQDLFDTATTDKKAHKEKKQFAKLDLMDEFDAMDDTITGGWRKKLKDANDNHTNPWYALMGEEMKKTRYAKHHKARDNAKKADDEMKAQTLKEKTSFQIEVEKQKTEFDMNVKMELDGIKDVESLLKEGRANALASGDRAKAHELEQLLDNLTTERVKSEVIATNAAKVLEDLAKLKMDNKNIEAKDLGRATAEMRKVLVDAQNALSEKKLREALKNALKGLNP